MTQSVSLDEVAEDIGLEAGVYVLFLFRRAAYNAIKLLYHDFTGFH